MRAEGERVVGRKFIETGQFFQALHDAGIVEDDPTMVRRVVIDLAAGEVGVVYIEKFADADRLEVALGHGLTVVEGPQA